MEVGVAFEKRLMTVGVVLEELRHPQGKNACSHASAGLNLIQQERLPAENPANHTKEWWLKRHVKTAWFAGCCARTWGHLAPGRMVMPQARAANWP